MEKLGLLPTGMAGDNSEMLLEPDDIYLDSHIFDVKFSPFLNVIATGEVGGEIRL